MSDQSDSSSFEAAQSGAKASDAGNEHGSPAQSCGTELPDLVVTVKRVDTKVALEGDVQIQINGAEARSGKTKPETPHTFSAVTPGDYEVGATADGWAMVASAEQITMPESGVVEVTVEITKRILTGEWKPAEAWCSEEAKLEVKSQALAAGKTKAELKTDETVGTLEADTAESHTMIWEVKDLPFTGAAMPDAYDVKAELGADGMKAVTDPPLKVKRVPDFGPKTVSFSRTSGVFGWDASFKASIEKDALKITHTLDMKKAWLGKWVQFSSADGDPNDDWVWIKKDGAAWKWWDENASPAAWKGLPRAFANYTANEFHFVKSGSKFVGRDDASSEWPEAFPEPTNFDSRKASWLANIHDEWDDKFDLVHDECKSAEAKRCKWRVRVKVDFSDSSPDETAYAVWSQEYERSDSQNWYLADDDAEMAGHELGHLIGAYDEYTDGALDPATNTVDDDSLMGQNLAGTKPRHLDGLRDAVKDLINQEITPTWKFVVKTK